MKSLPPLLLLPFILSILLVLLGVFERTPDAARRRMKRPGRLPWK